MKTVVCALLFLSLFSCGSRHEKFEVEKEKKQIENPSKSTPGDKENREPSEQGKKEEDTEGGKQSIQPPPLEPKFSSLNVQIFSPRCVSCHSKSGGRRPYLETYDDFVVEDNDIIYLDEPEDSPLLYRMTHQNSKKVMPPPTSGKPIATEEEIEVILKWIQIGAPQ